MSLTEEQITAGLKVLRDTNFTKTIHSSVYPAIDPTNPKLSQAGRVVLIPGGGSGVGFGIAKAFVQASADTIIIIGRRANVLEEAVSSLEQEAKTAGTNTKIITHNFDVTDIAAVQAFWKDLAAQGITVDVFVANVAKFTEPKPLLELGADEIWSQFEVNAKSPLYFVEKFAAQPSEKQKFIVNVTSQVISMAGNAVVAARPGYTLTKMAGAFMFQLIAQSVPAEKMQIVSYHPGLIYGSGWEALGIKRERFDDAELGSACAVWLASKEAEFLHGRFIWSAWDVEELATGEIRKRIEEDPYYLRTAIGGLSGSFKA